MWAMPATLGPSLQAQNKLLAASQYTQSQSLFVIHQNTIAVVMPKPVRRMLEEMLGSAGGEAMERGCKIFQFTST